MTRQVYPRLRSILWKDMRFDISVKDALKLMPTEDDFIEAQRAAQKAYPGFRLKQQNRHFRLWHLVPWGEE